MRVERSLFLPCTDANNYLDSEFMRKYEKSFERRLCSLITGSLSTNTKQQIPTKARKEKGRVVTLAQ